MEVYGNTITGEWDTGSMFLQTTYSDSRVGYYNLYFHDNVMGWNTPQDLETNGLQIEGCMEGVFITHNTFKNLQTPIYFCQFADFGGVDDYVENIYVYSNLMYNVGRNVATSAGWGIRFECGTNVDTEDPPIYYDDIYIWNNTIVAYATHPSSVGILLPTQTRTASGVTDVYVRNNIIQGFTNYAVRGFQQDNDYPQTMSSVYVTYNNFYGNGNNAVSLSGGTPTGDITTGNITTTPLFTSSTVFTLQTGSGAIRTGTYIGSPNLTDRVATEWYYPTPSMGCYEGIGGSSPTGPTVTTTAITAITATTASSGGDVSSDGGAAVTARGVCWSTSTNPTTSDSKTTDGTGTGAFTSAITGLTGGLLYYVRAYAINSTGTAYGNQRSFTAQSVTEYGIIKHTGRWIILNGKLIRIE